MSKQRSALIVTGGEVDEGFLRSFFERNNKLFVVGVDGGCENALNAGLRLDLMYGDFDTLNPKIKEKLILEKVDHIILESEKDVTDTHGAIDELCSRGFEKIVIVGGLGSRIDHSLANLMLSFRFLDRLDITFIDPQNRIRFYEGPNFIRGKGGAYQYLSMIPVTPVIIHSTTGLKYNLQETTMTPYDSLGISNEPLGSYSINLSSGKIMLVESNDPN